MNMVCASTYLYLLQFLSSVSYNFLSIDLLNPWLNLAPGILFFFVVVVEIVNGIVFFASLTESPLFVYKNTTDF